MKRGGICWTVIFSRMVRDRHRRKPRSREFKDTWEQDTWISKGREVQAEGTGNAKFWR